MTVADFAQHMMALGLQCQGSVISWGRTLKRNQAVRGHENSCHLYWLACDMVFDTREGAERATRMAPRLGISWKWNGDLTIHFQALPPQ